MKYDDKAFNSAVEEYKGILEKAKNSSFLVIFDVKNRNAFLSIAPLSRALHELGNEVNATGINNKPEALEAIKDVWKIHKELKEGKSRGKTAALKEFIQEVEKKTNGEFEKIFKEPDYTTEAKETGFEGSFNLPFRYEWFREYKAKEMDETCKKIWKDVYNLKDNENVSIGFVLIQKDEMLGHPLEDYLDSYAICWHMLAQCNGSVTMGAYTHKKAMREKGDRISELRATLQLKRKTNIPYNKCILVNVRINKNRKLDISCPCSSCFNLLKWIGYKEIFYTNKLGNFEKFSLDN